MKAVCFGSLNIDHTYQVDHFVKKGETISSSFMQDFPGGKGLNQSIALSKAGVKVFHAGAVGMDGRILLDTLSQAGVDSSLVKKRDDIATGHAIIQIDSTGDNCILLYGGANQTITREYVDWVMTDCKKDDVLILQNEINEVPYIVEKAKENDMYVVLNPSPMDEKIMEIDLTKIDLFVLNEIEAGQLTGEACTVSGKELIQKMLKMYPDAEIMLTLGEKGAIYGYRDMVVEQESIKTNVVDTTAAGDTFLGYFVAGKMRGLSLKENLHMASKAAAIAISRKGASTSIPALNEVWEMT